MITRNTQGIGALGIAIVLGFLGAAEAEAQVTVTSSTLLEHQIRFGESAADVISVANHSDQPQEVRLYLTDYTFSADGRTAYGEPGSEQRSNASWVRLGNDRVVVPARAEVTVPLRVEVPTEGVEGGTYWSMIMVEGVGEANGPSEEDYSLSLRTVIRHGIQLATHLPGGIGPDASFSEVRVKAEARKSLEFDLTNTGDIAFRPLLMLELYAPDGSRAERLSAQRGLLYPGTSIRQTFPIDDLETGSYQALLIADIGGSESLGVQFQLEH